MISNVEDVARRQPLIFVGAAFLLGVAASRFIKAAGGGQQGQASRSAYGSGGTPEYRRSASYEATGPGSGNGNEGF